MVMTSLGRLIDVGAFSARMPFAKNADAIRATTINMRKNPLQPNDSH
jgi:hypothetical protein